MRRSIISLLALLGFGLFATAQTQSDLRFNEVNIERDTSGCVVEAWAEIYNTSTTALDMTGLYISNDRNNLKMYKIPYGSIYSQVMSQGYVVVHGNGESAGGPMYSNIDFATSEKLYLVENNGYTVIDSVEVPKSGGISRDKDGVGEWVVTKNVTSCQSNVEKSGVSTAERFMQVDPHGGGMALISMSVVFSALVMLAIVFTFIGNYFSKHAEPEVTSKKKKKSKKHKKESEVVVAKSKDDEDLELALATVVVLHKQDKHDEVSGVITIERKDNRLWKRTTIFQ